MKIRRDEILSLINQVLQKNDRPPVKDDAIGVRDAGFRSLDFSEVALRIEDLVDRELPFEAATMRRIATIKDVVDFFEQAAGADVV
jgi:acyl carrier protein